MLFKHAVIGVLVDEGIGKRLNDGRLDLNPEGWYSQESWLRAFARIAADGGDGALFKIGQRIPENAQFPPWVVDVHSAIRSINIACHMNHRKSGKVMFDPENQEMLDGIGHYGYSPVEGEQKIISECENPYPCEFDRGIVTAMARKFELNTRVVHDDSQPCRKNADRLRARCERGMTW
ncbi:hypothetical protein ACFL6C_08420 [Myxococcota bacterium]